MAESKREDTNAPQNPPNSVIARKYRRAALWTYLGPITLLFVIAGGIWLMSSRDRGEQEPAERGTAQLETEGTTGEGHEQTPGGYDPQQRNRPGDTKEELERRGAVDEPLQDGPMPGLRHQAVTEIGDALEDPAQAVGNRISVRGVDVVQADGQTFWIQDGSAKIAVVAPDGAPRVRAGQQVDVNGTLESDGANGVRIRAVDIRVR